MIHKRAVIGNNVIIGIHAVIAGRSNLSEVPTIEDDVQIGANALILGPIRIGKGAIVGAGAVVLTDIPPGAVFVGNPARDIQLRHPSPIR